MTNYKLWMRRKEIKKKNELIVELYPAIVNEGTVSKRSPRRKPSSKKQKEKNAIRAEKNIKDLMAMNFKPGDLFITLTFANPVDKATAKKAFQNFRKRVIYHAEKVCLGKFKYIAVLEEEPSGKYCVHLVVERRFEKVVCEEWMSNGFFGTRKIYGNFKRLAQYFRKRMNPKEKICTSRNLLRPEVRVRNMTTKEILDYSAGCVPDVTAEYPICTSCFEFLGLNWLPHRVFRFCYNVRDT